MADSDDDIYEIPLTDQRVFGAGIKRKRIKFVPSTTPVATTPGTPSDDSQLSAGEKYLNAVLGKSSSRLTGVANGIAPSSDTSTRPTCDICHLPFSATSTIIPHEASLAHQLCLRHSYPPSALDRNRKGLAVLQSYGWDPDARTGLGASGEGILHPIKPKEKRNTVGLGVKNNGKGAIPKEKAKKMDAGQVRKAEQEDRRKREQLHKLFYQNDDVERYLGGNG
ncbi:hypothetical protein B0A49_07289 [Cryomyces minteri]|uniref:G-patch domain-containing protein n=1 Tax=Cryomyces minteri TaxID=331657 RepID=A0A4U0WXE0_9PEZI|nr:hypothetical protein B0A49_08284 [Cryomyces minteri]TKA70967.1 hypothetical protein B0A49_07289 [Cryomyces minteri]